jgi:hypothetical protein
MYKKSRRDVMQKAEVKVKSFREKIYFHRDKEDNWDLEDKAERLGFKEPRELAFLGYEVEMEVEVSDTSKHRVLSIQGVDVSDKNIFI